MVTSPSSSAEERPGCDFRTLSRNTALIWSSREVAGLADAVAFAVGDFDAEAFGAGVLVAGEVVLSVAGAAVGEEQPVSKIATGAIGTNVNFTKSPILCNAKSALKADDRRLTGKIDGRR
jgi:hypothetical protein